MSRAAITQDPVTGQADLYIYLAPGAAKLDLSLTPSFLRRNLTRQRILWIDGASAGSLIIKFGCGGCSNDSETTLSIVHRGGDFLVAGLTRAWDTREGQGSCDIDFLTGRGIASTGLDDRKPVEKRFRPMQVKLARWSDDRRQDACKSLSGSRLAARRQPGAARGH
jgi:hypothetical protein